MAYKYITISAKIGPFSELMTKDHADGIIRESEQACAAPAMLALLKRAQKALLNSRPVGSITPEVERAHVTLHDEIANLLVSLKVLE